MITTFAPAENIRVKTSHDPKIWANPVFDVPLRSSAMTAITTAERSATRAADMKLPSPVIIAAAFMTSAR